MKKKNIFKIAAPLFLFAFINTVHAVEMKTYGIQKQTSNYESTKTDTYKKKFGKTKNGNNYGGYVNSTKKYKDNHSERDTSANEVPGGSNGVGVYYEY